MGKGSKRRPRLISKEEEIFRWKYAMGEYPGMEEWEFHEKIKILRGDRGGKLIR